MIDLISIKTPIEYSNIPNEHSIHFIGGFRSSLNNINIVKNFVNIDKGYIQPNPKVTDFWRMSYNKFQQTEILDVPDDRIGNIKLKPWKKDGSYIIILAPNPHPLDYYFNTKIEQWLNEIKIKLLKLTDRKIFVRYKDNKKIRSHDPLKKYLNDCYAIITLQSLGSVEATLEGIPCINLAPSCLQGLHNMTLDNIENLIYPENRFEWLKSLTYSQFTWSEMRSGYALNTIEKYQIGK